MTAPTTLSTSSTGHDDPRGYGRTALGALIGVVVVAGVGIAVGIGLMELYYDPNGGLENLGLLLFPIALGAVGTLVGAVLGVRTALRRVDDPLASRTAGLTIPVGILGLVLVPAWGIGLAVLVAMPFVARALALRLAARERDDSGGVAPA